MEWRSYLLVTVMASSWSTGQLSGVIYTLTSGKDPDFSYEVRCFYDGSAPKPWEIQLMVNNLTLETERIDESAISYAVNLAQFGRKSLEFRCIWPGNESTSAMITKWTFLKIKTFECDYTDTEMVLNCNFWQEQEDARTSQFILIMNSTLHTFCLSSNNSTRCTLPNPIDFRGLDRYFTVRLDSPGISRLQTFYLTDIQMRMPSWPIGKPHIEHLENATCVDFGLHALESNHTYEWKVRLWTGSPGMPRNIFNYWDPDNIISHLKAGFNGSTDVCFKTTYYHFTIYEAYISVRFNHSDAPFNRYTIIYETNATVPERPPKFLSEGYYYDPEKMELFVFWELLDVSDFNGPNFTYIVRTDSGKEPSLKGNNSAVFKNWDPTRLVIVSLWSRNSMGRSSECDNLTVPILTDFKLHQVQNLQYDIENHTITWDLPQNTKLLRGLSVIYCSASKNSNLLCKDNAEIICHEIPKWRQDHTHNEYWIKGPLKVAVSAEYSDDSGGGMKWYTDPSDHPDIESNSIGIEISLSIASVIVLALVPLIFFSFQAWKRKKIDEFVITLPPIFDPIAMDRLRLRNVNFAYCHDPTVESSSSVSAPWRIFLDSKETTKIVSRTTAQSTRSADTPDNAPSMYTEMGTALSTTNSDPPEIVSSPYTVMEIT